MSPFQLQAVYPAAQHGGRGLGKLPAAVRTQSLAQHSGSHPRGLGPGGGVPPA